MTIQIQDLTKKYNDLLVLDNYSMSFEDNNIYCIMGPSGCGKTTLLNIICGLTPYDSGSISGIEDKKFSYIFQEDRLLPWYSVIDNICFVLDRLYPKEKARSMAFDAIKNVHLTGYEDYYPKELSGGMKRRVSIARAFSYPSDILIMDEPFKGLDHELKTNLLNDFTALWKENKRTVLFVTHDLMEYHYMKEHCQAQLISIYS